MSRKIKSLTFALGAGMVCVAPAVHALSYDINGVGITLDTRLAEGVAVRMENPDPQLVGISYGGRAYSNNADNADLAFKSGQIAMAASTITSALTISYENIGIFTRANYVYDPRLKAKDDLLNPADFGTGHQYSEAVRQRSLNLIKDHIASDGTILDLYAYGNFDIYGHALNIKVGKQIVNWGESTLVLNGLNSIVALDANKARIPGAEIDQFVIPVPQVFASVNLFDDASVEAWYQWKWEPTIVDATGSYFETNDYASPDGVAGNLDFGRAGKYAVAGTSCYDSNTGKTSSCVLAGGSTPRGPDHPAKDDGQFGVAVRFSVPELNDLQLAFYGADYHSRLPVYSTLSSGSVPNSLQTQVFAEYPDNIHMFGTSFNMSLPGGFSLQGEYSLKLNQPIEIDDVEQSFADLGLPSQINPNLGATLGGQYIRGWESKKVGVFDLGTTKILAPSRLFGYDELLIIGEAAVVHVYNMEPESQMRFEGPGTFLPGVGTSSLNFQLTGLTDANGNPIAQQGGFATSTSWGYKFVARATYNNVLPALNFKPALRFDHDVGGVTPIPLGNFVRGTRVLTPTMGFQYGSNTTAELGYSYYFGGGQGNLLRDRDFLFLDMMYEF
jgi:hypothetical protein